MSLAVGVRAPLRAVIFDVDGTVAETERDGHRVAFNRAFRDHDLPFEWGVGEYGDLLRTTGGKRRLMRFLVGNGFSSGEAEPLATSLHRTKNAYFSAWVHSGALRPRPGVHALMRDLRDNDVAVAVATTGSRAWVCPLLERLFPDIEFSSVVTGDDVQNLKPSPEAYVTCLQRLGVEASQALAIEDAPAGAAAAVRAGIGCLVVTSAYNRHYEFPGARAVLPGFLAMDYFAEPVRDYLRNGVTGTALARLHADVSLR